MVSQLAYQEQFLRFFRFVLENLQSTPAENPNWAPRALSLSLRAGAIKAYVQLAGSIIEGALAAQAARIGIDQAERLYRKPLGPLLRAWMRDGAPRPELAAIWDDLQMLKRYRNFIHLGNAAENPDAYWQEVVGAEEALLGAADRAIEHLSTIIRGGNGG